MKVKVEYMSGGRFDGYYYIRIEGTDLIACSGGHPDFVLKFDDFSKNAEKEAKKCANKINEQLKKLKDG